MLNSTCQIDALRVLIDLAIPAYAAHLTQNKLKSNKLKMFLLDLMLPKSTRVC